jgi:hypothetical protein
MTTTQRTRVARWGGALLLAVAPLPWLGVGAAAATPGDDAKITICHRTNAVTNPYVVITVDVAAADGDLGNDNGQGDHYAEHLGPVFDPEADYQPPFSGDEWGDIIPPIPGVHDGLNWSDAGQAIYANDCTPLKPQPSPSETQTTPESSSPEVTPSESSSSPEVSPSETSSSPEVSPSETSSSPEVSPSETSSSPEVSPSESSSSPEVSPSETSPGPTITESSSQPEVSPSEDTSVKPNRSEKPGVLPQTGSGLPVGSALVASMLMIVLGALLLMGPGRLAVERYHRRH